MYRIEAYIKSHRLNEAIGKLHDVDGLTGVSVTEIRGFGRTRGEGGPVHIVDNQLNRVQHVKLEVFCSAALKERVIEAIVAGAHTGLRADGKIYVSAVEDAVRISTGERGETAV